MIVDKYTPSYNLEEFKRSHFDITVTAAKDAAKIGFDMDGIRAVVRSMKKEHFYKSMTSYSDHKIWQDVYHIPFGDKIIYIKFTKGVITEFRLLSFKEK